MEDEELHSDQDAGALMKDDLDDCEDNQGRYPNKTFKRGVDWNTNTLIRPEPRKVAREIEKKIDKLDSYLLLPDLRLSVKLDPQ